MQINIEKSELLKGTSAVLGVVDKRGYMPILKNCLLQANGDGLLTLAATDLEISLRGGYRAEVIEAGEITLPVQYLHNLVKEMPGDSLISLTLDGSRLTVQSGESIYKLDALTADQYPPIPEIPEMGLVEVPAATLKEMVEKVIFSVGAESGYGSQPLSGVLWESFNAIGEGGEDAALKMVSTDGHRLTVIDRVIPKADLNLGEGILVPIKGMKELLRFLEGQATVSLGISEVGQGKNLVVLGADRYLFIRLLDKKFPDYRKIIPSEALLSVRFHRQPLIDTLKRLSLMSTERFKGIIFDLDEAQAEISHENPEVGHGREVLQVECKVGEAPDIEITFPVKVGFNSRYLLEPLYQMTGEFVFLDIIETERPCRLTSPDDPFYLAVIMPVNL